MTETFVFVEQLSMRVGRGASGTQALHDVTFAVAPGELLALVGPNGAGKSTIVLILATLLRPTGGHARIMGDDVAHAPAAVRRSIGVALQETGLDPRQSVRRIARLHARLHGYPRRASREHADATLALLGLTHVAGRPVGRLSGGMRRRVDLALALLHAPPVLLLDEPTTGLDPQSRRALWDEIERLRDDGAAIVLTTQQLAEAEQLADRVAIVDAGRIVVEGSPAALKHQMPHAVLDTTFGCDADAAAAARLLGGDVTVSGARVTALLSNDPAAVSHAIARLDAHELRMSALAVREPTLEDVLIASTVHADGDV
jgi:ABC-2 type transport system ATP-binding protein